MLDNSLNSISTVLEILDKCPAINTSTNSENDLLETIELELKQKLESWSDPEPSPSQAAQSFENEGSTRRRMSIEASDDKKKLNREDRTDHWGWSNGAEERLKNANYGDCL